MNLSLLLPKTIDNDFRGLRIGLVVFSLITAIIVVRSCIHIFAPDGGAQSIATIPLDRYSPAASATIISMFALWGQSQLLLGLIFLIVIFRYRSLVPLCYLILVLEWGGRLVIGFYKPIETLETAPGAAANLPVAAICAVMLLLSLIERKRPNAT